MKAFVAFCKKEWTESLRTYKLIVMLAAFALFGLMSPLIARMLPDILSGSDLGGLVILLPEPTAMDSWTQFFNNVGQMGVVVLVIVFCGITANDLGKGTLVNILTKGMKRRTVLFSKVAMATVLWTASYGLSLAVAYAYTVYFWGHSALSHAFFAFTGPWAYGLLLIALMVLGGICFKNLYGTLGLAGGAVGAMSLLNIVPQARQFNPASLSGDVLHLLNGQKVPGDFVPALVLCLALSVLCIAGSWWIFDHRAC